MKKNIFCITALLVLITSSSFSQQKQAQIIVGPNLQVSNDGNSTHAEIMLAANPIDPNNLVGGAQKFPVNNNITNQNYSKLYITRDGGKTWDDIEMPKEANGFGPDPQVAFGIQGTIYFSIETRLYRSEDGGKTWQGPLNISDNFYGLPKGADRPNLAVDQTVGSFAGRVYMAGMSTGMSGPYLRLWRSSDDGRTFIGPTLVTKLNDPVAISINVLISSKGFVFCPYYLAQDSTTYLTLSKDGGVSFSQSKKVVKSNLKWQVAGRKIRNPYFAINNVSQKFLDRLYVVYTDTIAGNLNDRIMLSYSDDEGDSWSKPKVVDISCPTNADQYNIGIALNAQGIVGIRWYDTRGVESKGFNEYFAASVDGGETFLPAVKVSTESSSFLDFSNEKVKPYWTRTIDKQSLRVSFHRGAVFEGALDFGRMGGHYTQFTADATGMFHDFWTDSRDGRAYEIYTSAIKVELPKEKVVIENKELAAAYEKAMEEAEKKKALEEQAKKEQALKEQNKIRNEIVTLPKAIKSLTHSVSLEFDTSNYDTLTQELSFPVRLKNRSDKTIYGPIKVELSKIDTTSRRKEIPVILNAINRKKGVGAVFIYAGALLPGEMTSAQIWKLKVKIPRDTNPSHVTAEQDKAIRADVNYFNQLMTGDIAELFFKITGYVVK